MRQDVGAAPLPPDQTGTPVSDGTTAPFPSVLFGAGRPAGTVAQEAPAYFRDLNLDQVAERLTAGRGEYDLGPFFFSPLTDVGTVACRHEVFADLDGTPALGHVRDFALNMGRVRASLAHSAGLRYRYQKERWFLDAAAQYADTVASLTNDLGHADISASALVSVRDYLIRYMQSDAYTTLGTDMERVHNGLDEVAYCTNIRGLHVEVSRYADQADYSAEVLKTFEKFKQNQVNRSPFAIREAGTMNRVEERIHDLVADLFPEAFADLDQFCAQHCAFLDPVIARFDREMQFFVSYLEFIEPLKRAGLPFCYPEVSATAKAESVTDAFDVALACRLVADSAPIVCNDYYLEGPERILVVTGPNQGGKTTFARMFGQLHHLASLGCPIPGSCATVYLPDRIFTHFENQEDPTSGVSKLEDDLLRVHAILTDATSASVAILNEVFNSTTLHDATFLGTEILGEIALREILCVCVTFVDELASLGPETVSMVSMVDPDNVARRTFKVVRRHADGVAHATALADMYGLTYGRLKARIAS